MTSSLQITLNGASIFAVPSVHFRLAFVHEVNRLCSTEKPDAVAVELGPATAAAATSWLRELGVSPGRASAELPCMLGLLRPNYRIRPSYREAAVRLQKLTGKELDELSPEILRQYLGYSAFSVLPLSSTDSIVEAMRCALELGIPLYGVDLEETAERREKTIMLQDPAAAFDSFAEYVHRNETFAEQQRDEEVDGRREIAMAARLKTLSETHRRIVFVCGLAHWRRLLTLIRNAELRPASIAGPSEHDSTLFTRVILHPLLAIHHLDTYPQFSAIYEEERRNASQRRSAYRQSADDRHEVFVAMLQSTYQKHFQHENSGEQLDRGLEDWEAKGDFQQLLQNFCALRQYRTPDILTALTVAQTVMSDNFCRTLAETFMDHNWATPNEYRDLPVLALSAPASGTQGTELPSGQGLRTELVYPDGQRSKSFYVQSFPGRYNMPMSIPIRWQWNSSPPPYIPIGREGSETWVPTEDLINALLLRAVRVARSQDTGPHIEAFEGSLLDGVDVKTTLRSAARGEDQVFVRSERRKNTPVFSSDEDMDGFPVVWIFRLMEGTGLRWKFSVDDLSNLSSHDFSEQWTAAGLPDAGLMITSVAAVTEDRDNKIVVELSTPEYEVTTDTIVGKLSYWPQCCVRRTAEWALETRLTRNPVFNNDTFEDLVQCYRERYGFEVGNHPWHVTLIRMAIPLANKAITVVAPDGYVLPRIVYDEAALRRIQVRVVPLSYFPSEVLRRISRVVWLPVLRREFDDQGVDIPVYPEHVQRYFGEPMDTYRRLVPAKWWREKQNS